MGFSRFVGERIRLVSTFQKRWDMDEFLKGGLGGGGN